MRLANQEEGERLLTLSHHWHGCEIGFSRKVAKRGPILEVCCGSFPQEGPRAAKREAPSRGERSKNKETDQEGNYAQLREEDNRSKAASIVVLR
jgi:hypothetical protein